MELWFQFVSGILAFIGTARQAVDARKLYERFEANVLTPSRELLGKEWAVHEQEIPRWNLARRRWERFRFTDTFYRKLWVEDDHEQWRRMRRQAVSWLLLMYGALAAVLAVVWVWAF
ncbi:hypothetical protein C8K38_103220 [Rhodococcus sp. OK611]|uniref:hypothetical protein n=1 Tax=unclassified Rhodococcus (in: high G+C Gram-positive bacteria) TaxID=192944 RepID=UPI000BC79329|nr:MULTISPECIES: hypothetical protein [unclassified Rhodococcus (in: high G+C Gram-positive bacteria)]PTR44723.1 hypothetical protein C8K38_103220 [Rhodococcus sp. OK611]SNX90164.1 hypothetical protein SAMN05447004_104220 [Rhodococcus sp. OK270]